MWDEFVGLWVALWAVPVDWPWVVLGFLLFRFFDVLKPWPIRVLDRRVHGGFGIMVDDIVAGIMACACLHACDRVAGVTREGVCLMRSCFYAMLGLTLLLGVNTVSASTPRIQVEALFPNAAVLKIDGQRKMLKQGQSYRGADVSLRPDRQRSGGVWRAASNRAAVAPHRLFLCQGRRTVGYVESGRA